MVETSNEIVEQAFSEALETMALITPLPPEDDLAPPAPAVAFKEPNLPFP